jgi:hypothetical protein
VASPSPNVAISKEYDLDILTLMRNVQKGGWREVSIYEGKHAKVYGGISLRENLQNYKLILSALVS